MRASLLLIPLLALPVCASAQPSRLPVRICAWTETGLTRLPAYYDHGTNRLFGAATGAAAFALPTSAGYAREASWYANSDTLTVGDGRFASFRGAAVMDEATLAPAGSFEGVPLFRRATDRIETLYALVGSGFRPDAPRPYTDGGRCEFQPYRRLAPAPITASAQ